MLVVQHLRLLVNREDYALVAYYYVDHFFPKMMEVELLIESDFHDPLHYHLVSD